MGFFLFSLPMLLALAVLVATFLAVAWFSGAFRPEREEARFGIGLLCAMRWAEYSRLISEVLKDRGLQPSNSDRPPGKDGFDLLFMRGNSRYLVQCTNAINQQVSASTVGQLYTLTQMQDADGAIIASCAPAEASAMKLAQERRIEVIADRDLWAHVKPWVAHDQRSDAEQAARTLQRRHFLTAALAALVAAIAAYALAALLIPTPEQPPPVATSAPAQAVRTPAANKKPGTEATPGMPDQTLTTEQLASRRASAVLEVRSLSHVSTATWSSQSTLELGLHAYVDDAALTKLVDDVCGALLQYEELRFTRLQVGVPSATAGQPDQVRWRQCR